MRVCSGDLCLLYNICLFTNTQAEHIGSKRAPKSGCSWIRFPAAHALTKAASLAALFYVASFLFLLLKLPGPQNLSAHISRESSRGMTLILQSNSHQITYIKNIYKDICSTKNVCKDITNFQIESYHYHT